MLQNEFNGGLARYTAKVAIGEHWVVFLTKSVRVGRFTDPGRTSFAASDVTPAYAVIPAQFYAIRSQYSRNF